MLRPVAVRTLSHRFFAFFAVLAMVAQAVVAVAPLAEGRTARMESHVEAHGSASHFTHNEANCVACQARSLHASTPPTENAPIIGEHAAVSRPGVPTRVASADHSPQTNPRAPPTLI
jgi:hypothetical protein